VGIDSECDGVRHCASEQRKSGVVFFGVGIASLPQRTHGGAACLPSKLNTPPGFVFFSARVESARSDTISTT